MNRAPTRRRRSALPMTVVAALVSIGALAISASASAQEPWGFEQVTPVEKGAGSIAYVDTYKTSRDGDALLYTTNSEFSSVPADSMPAYMRYLGVRGPSGWTNTSVDPPIDLTAVPNTVVTMLTLASSNNLAYSVVTSTKALAPGAVEGGGNLYLRESATGALTLIAATSDSMLTGGFANTGGTNGGPILVSSDGSKVIFRAQVPLTPEAESADDTSYATYAWTAQDGLEMLSISPESEGGEPVAGGFGVNDTNARNWQPLDVSAQRAYFATRAVAPLTGGLYLREGSETTPVSYSRIPGDPTQTVFSLMDAFNADNSVMLFHTNRGRLTEDSPNDNPQNNSYFYLHDAESGSLTYVGYGAGSRSGVQQMDPGANTVIFQSDKDLSGDGQVGVRNLYAWRDGETKLITTHGAGSTPQSGAKWIRMLSENGRYFAFTDNSTALAAEFGVDIVSDNCQTQIGAAGPCQVVYVYDVVEDKLSCASCDPAGGDPSHEAGDPGVNSPGIIRMDGRAPQFVANDGTVFFATADPLVSNDVNGALDVYVYQDGETRLITKATQGAKYARFIDATVDGKKVFIATDAKLAPTDTDKSVDIYRTGPDSGFDYTPPDITPPCEGAECREQTDPMPLLPSTGSIDFQGGGNPKQDGKVVVHRAGKLKGTKIRLRIDVPSAGKLAIGGNKLRNKRKSVSEPGSYRISTSLNNKGRKKLKRKRQLRVPVRVRFNPESGSASAMRFAVAMKANSTRKGR